MSDTPMTPPQYLDCKYPLHGLLFQKTDDGQRIGRIKVHHIGEFAITVEWKDGTRDKINVDPGCDIYPSGDYDKYAPDRMMKPLYKSVVRNE